MKDENDVEKTVENSEELEDNKRLFDAVKAAEKKGHPEPTAAEVDDSGIRLARYEALLVECFKSAGRILKQSGIPVGMTDTEIAFLLFRECARHDSGHAKLFAAAVEQLAKLTPDSSPEEVLWDKVGAPVCEHKELKALRDQLEVGAVDVDDIDGLILPGYVKCKECLNLFSLEMIVNGEIWG